MADIRPLAQVRGSASAPLGNTAKSRAIFLGGSEERQGFVDLDTGEITSASGYDAFGVRVERFALQSVVRDLVPDGRTASCLRRRQKGKEVEVWRSREHGSTAYAGLQTCASVWACPVCAAKISERRRIELVSAIALHKAQGGAVLLLTLTHAHGPCDALRGQIEGQTKALHSLMRNRSGRDLFGRIGCVGHVRAWEVTHGLNGWHPHFHILLFLEPSASPVGARGTRATTGVGSSAFDLVRLEREFSLLWRRCCLAAGLSAPSLERGARLDDGSYAARYASKWGLESELTKGHIKKSKGGATPFDLLRRCLVDPGDKRSGLLFREFAECFHGRRQLVWSRGLKARFLVVDVQDEELASRLDDDCHVLGRLVADDWRRVVRVEGRALVLELARSGWAAVELYLSSLRSRDVAL